MKTIRMKLLGYLLSFLTLFSIFITSGTALAGGVPSYSYTANQYFFSYYPSAGYQQLKSFTASQIDIGSPYSFSGTGSIQLNNFSSRLDYLEVFVSNDDVNWSRVAQWSSPTLTTWNYNLGGGMYQHIKLVATVDNCYTYNSMNGYLNQSIYSVIADQQTAQAAADNAYAANQAAQAAVSYAQNASTQASNASSYASQALNWLNGTWCGYNLGTVGQNATNAMNNSATANNYLTNGSYGLNAINTNVTNIQSGVNSLQTSTNNIQTGVNNLQTTANNIQTSVSNIQTSVNNITSVMPPTLNKVTGYNGATATSSTSFNVSLDYTNADEYSYKIDSGAWSTWSSLSGHDSLGYLTVQGFSGTGMHTVYIQIRNNVSGQISPVAKGKVVVFKL
jgi:hypothetical protein